MACNGEGVCSALDKKVFSGLEKIFSTQPIKLIFVFKKYIVFTCIFNKINRAYDIYS